MNNQIYNRIEEIQRLKAQLRREDDKLQEAIQNSLKRMDDIRADIAHNVLELERETKEAEKYRQAGVYN